MSCVHFESLAVLRACPLEKTVLWGDFVLWPKNSVMRILLFGKSVLSGANCAFICRKCTYGSENIEMMH